MKPRAATSVQLASAILGDELAERRVDLALADQALEAAVELLPFPRAEWARPTNPWEHLVVAVALAVARLEGTRRLTRPEALEAIRDALASLAERTSPRRMSA